MKYSPYSHNSIQQTINKFYQRHAPIYNITRAFFLAKRSTAINKLRLSRGDNVLDIGCGTGNNFSHLEKAIGAKGSITAVDASPEMLKEAQLKTRRNQWKNITLINEDAAKFITKNTFDALLFSYSLSIIPQWKKALHNSIKHLHPRGRIVILDFGQPQGIIGTLLHSWLSNYHVDNARTYIQELHKKGFTTITYNYLLGTTQVTIATRQNSASKTQ